MTVPGENKQQDTGADNAQENDKTALEQASGVKDDDQKALEHIQQTLDKADGDGGAAAPQDDKSKSPDDSGSGKPDAGATGGDNADEDKGKESDKDGKPEDKDEGGKPAEAEGKEDGKPSDDKIKALLDSGVFDEFRKEGSLTIESWGVLMDGIEALLNEVVSGRDRLRELGEIADQRRAEEFSARIDSVFDGLGEEFADAFGKGSASKLDKTFMDNRNAVLQKAETLILGYKAQGKEVTLEDAVKEAAGLYAAQNFRQPRQKPQQDRRSQFISKPGGEKSSQATGDEAALEFIDKFQRDHNESSKSKKE